MQKSLNRKSSNDASQPASGSGSSISKVLSRNLSLRGKQRKQGSTSGLNGCFKVAVISERNVPISELLVVIKKTCKLTRRRFQDQVAVQLRSDEMDVYKYCKCELPEETALTSDINHTVNTTSAILQYLNEDNLVHLTVIKMLEEVNLKEVLRKIKGYDAIILAYSVSENVSFIRIQTMIEMIASSSHIHVPILLTGLICDPNLNRQVSNEITSEIKDLFKILTVELDLMSPVVVKTFKESWSSLFKRIIWEREISSFKNMDESIKRYYSILSSSSNSAETSESMNKSNSLESLPRNGSSSLRIITYPSTSSSSTGITRKTSRNSVCSLMMDVGKSDSNASDDNASHESGTSILGALSAENRKGTSQFLSCLLDYYFRDRGYDVDVAKAFLAMYQKYLDPESMLNFVLREYHELESEAFMSKRGESHCNIPQLRLINLIILWMKNYSVDFSADMLATLMDFVQNSSSDNPFVFQRLQKMVEQVRRLSSCKISPSTGSILHSSYQLFFHKKGILSPQGLDRISVAFGRKLVRRINAEDHIDRILSTPNLIRIRLEDLDSVSVAEQITLMQWNIFVNIELRDLINHSILEAKHGSSKPKRCDVNNDQTSKRKNTLAEHFKHFNFIADWISTYILSFDTAAGRVDAIVKCIQIAMELRKLQNFSSLMAVIGGIHCPYIRRLKETQSLLKRKRKHYHRMLEDLSQYHNPAQSFAAYRQALRSCPAGTPVIPYLGVMTQDLLKINEGNDDFKKQSRESLSGGRDTVVQINIPKFKLIGELVEPWHRFKSMDYCAIVSKMERLQAWIRSRTVSDENELYRISRLRESYH